MNISNCFPSKFLKSGDIEQDTTYTIDRVEIESVGQGNDADDKPILYFREVDKGLVLNVTNSNTIASVLGTPETDGWVGKQITLFSTEVDFQGKMTLAIRVRMRAPKAQQAPAPATNKSSISPKLAAYKSFHAAWGISHPEDDKAAVDAAWSKAVRSYFPGRAAYTIGNSEWEQFWADDFQKKVASPIGEQQQFDDSQVPF